MVCKCLKSQLGDRVVRGKIVPDVSLEQVKQKLSEMHACYVLITCTEPSNDGRMEVEMDYDGDECLASMLVEQAVHIFENRLEIKETK